MQYEVSLSKGDWIEVKGWYIRLQLVFVIYACAQYTRGSGWDNRSYATG